MKANTARRIDDTDDPRLPHPMFPRSDGQQESRRIFYIRLFRKRTPDGPIEFCPVRFLASESRDQGWAYFVNRFGGGYYRAEATSSANKKQAYTGGSSLRWFHFAGPSKPFPLPGTTVQEVPEPSPPAMPTATWNEMRALLKSERRFFAEQIEAERKAGDERLEAERKAGDERMRAWMEHAEKMAQAESARLLAMEAMLRDERECARQTEEMLIASLKDEERRARWRENAAQQAAARAAETMRIQSENEAARLAYEHWEPVKIPRARKPRATTRAAAKPQSRGVGRPRKSQREDTRAQAARAHKEIHANAQATEASGVGRALNWIADHGSELAEGARRFESIFHRKSLRSEPREGVKEANASATQASEETATRNAEANASTSDGVVEAKAVPTSDVQKTPNTSPEVDDVLAHWPNAPAWTHKYLKRSEEPTQRENPIDVAVDAQAKLEAPKVDTSEQTHAEHAPTSARAGVSESESKSSDASEATSSNAEPMNSGVDVDALPPLLAALFRTRQQLEMQPHDSANTNTATARETEQSTTQAKREETTPTHEAPSIRVHRFPPRSDPEGMTTIRTLHGWVTIPSDWLKPDASPAQLASLSRLLSERP